MKKIEIIDKKLKAKYANAGQLTVSGQYASSGHGGQPPLNKNCIKATISKTANKEPKNQKQNHPSKNIIPSIIKKNLVLNNLFMFTFYFL